jgi:hypothetical protein
VARTDRSHPTVIPAQALRSDFLSAFAVFFSLLHINAAKGGRAKLVSVDRQSNLSSCRPNDLTSVNASLEVDARPLGGRA